MRKVRINPLLVFLRYAIPKISFLVLAYVFRIYILFLKPPESKNLWIYERLTVYSKVAGSSSGIVSKVIFHSLTSMSWSVASSLFISNAVRYEFVTHKWLNHLKHFLLIPAAKKSWSLRWHITFARELKNLALKSSPTHNVRAPTCLKFQKKSRSKH